MPKFIYSVPENKIDLISGGTAIVVNSTNKNAVVVGASHAASVTINGTKIDNKDFKGIIVIYDGEDEPCG
ncbi:hypothetical protein [Roseicella aerolata]|uniref:Uncharacterized protein n=1 Tax=Roseicella aerolata TaxID=2883479 RepID=A0A9X1IEJ6_9PROT|nr:hypothetical protein [Roseicella aerolata]MCB4822962.1 hypothetical protein [Roseicella aerolata]